jgi:hypothetical protein
MILKLLVVFLFFFQILLLEGQIHLEMEKINVDSLQQLLPGLDGTEKIDALNKLSLGLCRDFPDSSLSIANNTIALSGMLDYKKGLADGYFNLGNYYHFLDSIKPMVLNYLDALRIYEELAPSVEMGLVLDQLSEVNRLTGRYEQAKKYRRRAIHIYHLLSEHRYEIGGWLSFSNIYVYNHEWDSGFYYYDKVKGLLEQYPNDYLQSGVFFNYGWNYSVKYFNDGKNKEDINEAISWTLKAMELDKKLLADKSLTTEDWALGFNNVGGFYIASGTEENIKKGLDYLKKAKSIIDTLDIYVYLKLDISRSFAIHEREQGNYEGAIALLKNGLIEADTCMSKFSMKNYEDPHMGYTDKYYTSLFKNYVYWQLYQIYKELGDHKTALEYYILKEKAAEEIFLEDNRKLIAILEADSENEKTEKKIALLDHDNELYKMKVVQSRAFNLGVFILFVILALVGLLFIRQNKLKNEHKSTLLEQKLLRLQMNPHFIFNAFSNILRLIDTNENKKASTYLTTFGKLLRTTLESTREDMVPFEKEVSTLKNYLELQKLRYSEKFEYSLEVDEKIDQEDMSIPPMLVQPFIENAIEHGIGHKKSTGRIDVRFVLKDKKIICEVEDDGVGREKAWEAEYAERGGRKSLATEIIIDRIKVLNKKFKQKIKLEIIDKQSDKAEALGTKVLLDLPIGSVY